jgi:hypothetical protein
MFVVLNDAAGGAIWTDYGMVRRQGEMQFPILPRLYVEPTASPAPPVPPVAASIPPPQRSEKSRRRRYEKDVGQHRRVQKFVKVSRRAESNASVTSVNLGEYIMQVLPEMETIRVEDMYKGVTNENAWSIPYMKAANQDTCRLPDDLFNFMDRRDFIW